MLNRRSTIFARKARDYECRAIEVGDIDLAAELYEMSVHFRNKAAEAVFTEVVEAELGLTPHEIKRRNERAELVAVLKKRTATR